MSFTIIAAVSDNGVIGNNGKVPWHISEDMKRFKELTLGHPVVMGRGTYDSLPKRFRPLSDRRNIVLSSSLPQNQEEIYVARDTTDVLRLSGGQETFIIGGESVYRKFLPLVERMELTRIHRVFDGDTYFPVFDLSGWLKSVEGPFTSENDGISYSFETFLRKRN